MCSGGGYHDLETAMVVSDSMAYLDPSVSTLDSPSARECAVTCSAIRSLYSGSQARSAFFGGDRNGLVQNMHY